MRICIFNYLIRFQTIPLLMSLAECLTANNIKVDIFTVDDNWDPQEEGLRIINFKKFYLNNLSPIVLFTRSLSYFLKYKYDYIFAIDPQALIPSVLLSKIFGIKLAYISLEIFVKKDVNNIFYKNYYLQQKHLIKYAKIIIVPDRERKELLLRNTNIDEDKVRWYFLPNSTLSRTHEANPFFLHEKLRISTNQKILLFPGELDERSCAKELWEASKNLPHEYVVVLHSRRKKERDGFLRELTEHETFRLSLKPVDYAQLDSLYASAYIGLALYKVAESGSTAENIRTIGKSSGKLNNFLKLGIPVIMSDLPYFSYLADTYGCGVCLKDMSMLSKSIERISKSYEEYQQNAIRCFQEELDFEPAFGVLLNAIMNE